VLVDLQNEGRIVEASDPASSTLWDVGFQTSKVMVNGGAAGPAGIVAYCLCQNAAATPAQIMAMTPESELAKFEAVTAANVPGAGAGWSAQVMTDKPWYRYNLTGQDHFIWPTYDVYLIRRGEAVYKLQITGYYSATGDPRFITFRYAQLAG
jgi:hypothetical protein